MTLVISKVNGGIKLLNQLPSDADATAYFSRVEGATGDNQALEAPVKFVIINFILGCKADGIWNSIKASCILCGARTLSGALQPLVGTAPTNNNFVSGNYNRKTGLAGGDSRYLSANRAGNEDPQNNTHASIYVSTPATSTSTYPPYIGHPNTPQTIIFRNNNNGSIGFRCQTSSPESSGDGTQVGLIGVSRAVSTSFVYRATQTSTVISFVSQAPTSTGYEVIGSSTVSNNGRFAFYSIGESLDLAKLDARVTELINNIQAVTP